MMPLNYPAISADPRQVGCLAWASGFFYTSPQQHPPRLSTMRTRGVTFSELSKPKLTYKASP